MRISDWSSDVCSSDLRRGLVLRTDLLAVLGGWLTPIFEPKRYLTWFFVAALPEGQVTRDVSSETDKVEWMAVRDAIKAGDAKEMLLLPPTYATLCELFDARTPAQALAQVRAVPFGLIGPTFNPETGPLGSNDRLGQLGK